MTQDGSFYGTKDGAHLIESKLYFGRFLDGFKRSEWSQGTLRAVHLVILGVHKVGGSGDPREGSGCPESVQKGRFKRALHSRNFEGGSK